MDTVSIDTPQNVHIDFEIASLGDRFLAFFLDILVMMAYVLIMTFFLRSLTNGLNTIAFLLLVFAPLWLYHLLFEIFFDGQSLGKMARKIKVVKLDGTQAGIGNYLLRWILRPVDSFMALGLIVIIFNKNSQRIGDIAAGTTVAKISQKVTLADTILAEYPENYKPSYPQAAHLSNEHIALIKEVLNNHEKVQNFHVIRAITDKTKREMGITGQIPSLLFLEQVVKDYNYYANKE